jgi:hypothetical protein
LPHQAHPLRQIGISVSGDNAAELAQAVHDARNNAVAALMTIKWKKWI